MAFSPHQDDLVLRLQSADPAAIGHLYDAYGGSLFGAVLRIVQVRHLAEQVLQDTFVKVWRYSTRYDSSKASLFTWMLNIARNTAIDATRSAYFKQYAQTDNLDALRQVSGPEWLNTDAMDVRKVANQLEDKYRHLVDMVYFQGYTQQEAAVATGIPLGTAKTRLRYAIKEMRASLESDGTDHGSNVL